MCVCEVIIGTVIYRRGAYVIGKYLSNQEEIQQEYPLSELVLATNEDDFSDELESLLRSRNIRGRVIFFKTMKPDYARSRYWNVASGREAIRMHVLSNTNAKYLVFLDADMTFDPSIVRIMKKEIHGCDVVFSGYPLRSIGKALAAGGCMMLNRSTLENVVFRCHEFKQGGVIAEDTFLEEDLYQLGARVKKGYFLSIHHYLSEREAKDIAPQPVNLIQRIANHATIRHYLLKLSLLTQRNLAWKLKKLANRFYRL